MHIYTYKSQMLCKWVKWRPVPQLYISGKAFKFNFSLLTLQQKIIELKTKEFLELAEHVQSEMEKLV